MLLHAINDKGCGHYRILQPASLWRSHGVAMTQVHRGALADDALQLLDPDVVVFQLWQTDAHIKEIARYRKTLPNAHFVYEIDDLFWAVPETSFHRNNPLVATSKSQIRTAAKMCDSIVCSTSALAYEMKKLTAMRDVRVAMNALPHNFINSAIAGRRSPDAIKSDKPRVGWAGGAGHSGDLKIISEVVKALADEVQWVFFGMLPPGIDPKMVEAHGGVHFQDYALKLGTLNLDLALAPLEDIDFNHAKSNLRVLEYGACGFPVLASAVSTFAGCPVFQCENTTEAWIDRIRSLLSDSEQRKQYAEDLHQWVTSHWCMEDKLTDRLMAYLPRNASPALPVTNLKNVGRLVTVGVELPDFENYHSLQQAWTNAPGTDILYVRPGARVTELHLARLVDAIGTHASVSAFSNDGQYPVTGKFAPVDAKIADQIDAAAVIVGGAPVPTAFPSGPCILLSGTALARFGLPDVDRFGGLELALVDWGARAYEGGRGHMLAVNTYVGVETPLSQPPAMAQFAVNHVCAWSTGFSGVMGNCRNSNELSEARENLDLATNAMFYDSMSASNYSEWVAFHDTIGRADYKAMKEIMASDDWQNAAPLINVVMPTFNTDPEYLKAAINSVTKQTYTNWRLLIADDASTNEATIRMLDEIVNGANDKRIKYVLRPENGHICEASNTALEMAESGWVVFLDHDDMLAPHALFRVAYEVMQHPEAMLIYSDSDKLSPKGDRIDPYYAPDFSYELLLAQNYITHLCAYRLEHVKEIEGFKKGLEGSQDWDLALRYLEHTCGTPPNQDLIRHIPEVLYHWRQAETSTAANIMNKPYAIDAGRKAVMGHLQRTKQPSFVGPNPAIPIFNMVRFLVTDPAPKVSIIIPSKDNPEHLMRCVGSVLRNTAYGNFDVIVIDNGHKKRETVEAITKLKKTARVEVLNVPVPFNFAAFNNQAASHVHDAEFLCFLNDDTEIIEGAWLNDMVGLAGREGVGAVGAKLLYPDNTVQTFGTIFSADQAPGLSCIHMWQKMPAILPGQTGRALITQPTIAVSAACMVIKRSTFNAVGGFDAVTFPIDYNDVDICLRLHKAGYRNIASAQAVVRHYEGQTKKQTTYSRAEMLDAESRLLALHGDVVDPYINPNLAFTPHLNLLASKAVPKVWQSDTRLRVLIVNGTEQDAKKAFVEGDLPFCATLEGHYLAFTVPTMPHVRAIDLRKSTDGLTSVLEKLAITRIRFCGIGDGTLGSVGFFTQLAKEGWPVEFTPTEQAKTTDEHNYYTASGWAAVWKEFHEHASFGADHGLPAAAE